MSELDRVLEDVRSCGICQGLIPKPIRPMLQADSRAKILIISQAPGKKVHETGIIFNDLSGERLRTWMGISKEIFYDKTKIAILPMGFCYPGSSRYGDLPPRPECASTWHDQLLGLLSNIELTLFIGKYAQDYYFKKDHKSLTEIVRHWQDYWPFIMPLPHPSPRNNIWLKQNPWFAKEILPKLRQRVSELI